MIGTDGQLVALGAATAAAGSSADSAGFAEAPVADFLQPAPGAPAMAAAPTVRDEFVDFIMAKSNAAAAPQARSAPARVAGESRYAAKVSAAPAAPSADCVIQKPFCLPDAGLAAKQPDVGLAFAMKLKDLLVKEKAFSAIRITDEPGASGKVITLEDGVVNAMISPGGFFSRANVALSVTANVRLSSGNAVSAKASFNQTAGRGGNAKTLLEAGLKATATQVGNQMVRALSGAKHLRSEISGWATATCVFGCLGLIPIVGLVMLAIALITGTLTLVYNSGRAQKVGLVRLGVGLGIGLIGALLSLVILLSPSR
jgi:hypothetical protein